MTPEERTAQIDRELDRSLGVFDETLRREQRVIAQARGARDGSGSGGAGPDTEGSSGFRGGSDGGDSAQGAGAGSGGSAGRRSGGAGGQEGGESQGQGGDGSRGAGQRGGGGGYGGGPAGGAGPMTAPADIPDGSDDDIVARQLREAAMKETDPELREKLWQEYRNYKKGAK
jgi:hypothetical protein